jgi:hypothetical protein
MVPEDLYDSDAPARGQKIHSAHGPTVTCIFSFVCNRAR